MSKHTVKARSLEPGDVVDCLRIVDVREAEAERGTVEITGRPVGGGAHEEVRYWPANRLVEVERA